MASMANFRFAAHDINDDSHESGGSDNKISSGKSPDTAEEGPYEAKLDKKHVLFIVENSCVPIDIRVWSEALSAKEWGYDVTVLCPKDKKYTRAHEQIDGINVYRHPYHLAGSKYGYLLEYLSAFFWEILFSLYIFLKSPFQVIHGANPPDHLFLIAIFFKVFGVKYIFDHHDLSPESYVAKFNRKDLLYRVLLLMEKINFKTADLVISTNQSYKSVALKRGDKQHRDVFVVRNGPQLTNFFYPPANPDLKSGFDYLVAYIGVIGKQDQLDVLLKIVDFIVYQRKITNIKFMIIGTGPDWEHLVERSEEMNLTHYVEFTGFIPYEKVYEIFTTADICVNPEQSNEFTDKSTMIKIMEYMCFGKPIIQFDNTEGKVTAGEASIYIKDNNIHAFADNLIALVQDPWRKKKMGAAGKKRIHDLLQWDIQKKQLKKAYISLFSEEKDGG